MIDTHLVPEKTVVTAKGDGPAVDVSGATNRIFLVTLHIVNIVEQESLDVSIFGSSEGSSWGTKPIAAFPQKFYRGQQPLLVDLGQHPEVKMLRAHWDAHRWGRGTEVPMFEFHVRLKEVPPEVLREARAEAKAMA